MEQIQTLIHEADHAAGNLDENEVESAAVAFSQLIKTTNAYSQFISENGTYNSFMLKRKNTPK
jgi:hypothetical protein